MAKLPKIRICQGKTCRKKRAEIQDLEKTLSEKARMEEVGCQKICVGPVVGIKIDGCLEWFAALDSDKARRALGSLLDGGEIEKPLRKRRVPNRSGRLRD